MSLHAELSDAKHVQEIHRGIGLWLRGRSPLEPANTNS
jgi:hypothetical protein